MKKFLVKFSADGEIREEFSYETYELAPKNEDSLMRIFWAEFDGLMRDEGTPNKKVKIISYKVVDVSADDLPFIF